MGTPDKPSVTTTSHTETTDTVSTNPPAIVVNPDKGWISNVIDSMVNATKNIGVIPLVLVMLMSVVCYLLLTVGPKVAEYLEIQGKATVEQTSLMRETNGIMGDIRKENEKRNDMQEKAMHTQDVEATAIAEFQQTQQKALINHSKILESLALSNSNSATVLSNQHDIIAILGRMQLSMSGNKP